MNLLLALPLIIPLASAAFSLLAWSSRRVQRALAIAGTAALLVVAVALLASIVQRGRVEVTQIGGWPAPFGIVLVADLFSGIMVALTGIVGLAVAAYSLASIDEPRERFGYYPLLHILLMGVCGAFLTGDLFNLYVWFEVMLMASFVLLALGGEKAQVQGAIKYVTLNLLASALFLAAVGICYGLAGTLNLADLARTLGASTAPRGLVLALAMLLLVAFGIKAAAFPLFFWLPASYHTPPVAVSALFAGLLTKVGVYALIRVFTLVFLIEAELVYTLIVVISALTMITGVLGAAAQNEFRRILSFHIISQIGYMTLGLGLFGLATSPEMQVLALAGSVFYIAHHIIVKTNLFLVSGVAQRIGGTFDLKQLGGLYEGYPVLAVLFLVPALSLAGIPPLSGFFAKLILVRTGLAMQEYAIVAVMLVVGLLTLFSMTKIWAEAFWKAPPEADGAQRAENRARRRPPRRGLFAWLAPIAVLAAITVGIGLGVEGLFRLSQRAAEQLVDRDSYIEAVLGDRP